MKKILLLLLISKLLYSGLEWPLDPVLAAESTTSAESVQVSDLPAVHILPDNPLYFLKTLKEKVQLVITRSSSGQADLLLSFAQKRLAEALEVTEKGKVHIGEKLFAVFGQDIEAARKKIEEAQRQGEQTRDLLLKLQETIAYQKSVIDRLERAATESAKISTGGGLGIDDWLRGLFGRKEVLRPLAR